ncbi:sulfurtransferase complex subunit TusB [Mangrovimicrobium sediminis]|uniref:Sulfurtransferase complex subunit TusB n=1 Tax=Mangrovimicrobium sediminis TaxID=2562682 RepID=A0A4Z0M2C1_9GAMM|nr:sulfurtransferase complex subunit TusB [Haliea sp. SAOS-164]TGD73630.1 sulfurtransferase complex subunit TusB [Haliea sp. SAOS-164]
MILHMLSASPRNAAFADCLRVAGDDDVLVLLGDAVYAAVPGSEGAQAIAARPLQVYVLASDAAAAGINDRLPPDCLLDMDGLVTLSETCPRQMAWY